MCLVSPVRVLSVFFLYLPCVSMLSLLLLVMLCGRKSAPLKDVQRVLSRAAVLPLVQSVRSLKNLEVRQERYGDIIKTTTMMIIIKFYGHIMFHSPQP